MNKLPSLSGLRAFVEAAETKNFAKTARYLSVTPAAVSQQIKLLEQHLNVVLFERSKAGVLLTRAGQNYLPFAQKVIKTLADGQHAVSNTSVSIVIQAYPSVASLWLMPKVMEVMALHPEVEIRVEATHTPVDFTKGRSDACVSFGEHAGEVVNEFLFQDEVILVASPSLVAASLNSMRDVLKLPMIHIDWGGSAEFLPNWKEWLDSAGFTEHSLNSGPHFNLTSMAIEAAIQGKGLLLGQKHMVREALKANRLIQLSDHSLPLRKAYYLSYPPSVLSKPGVEALIKRLTHSE